MDINGFREPQSPWFFTQPPEYLVETRVKKLEAPTKGTEPTPDNRYHGWAAPMEDGRLATDYRPKCSANIATGTQFATRSWMQHNAESIMNLSQKRSAELVGAGRSYMPMEPAPAAYIKCNKDECRYTPAGDSGIGVKRTENVPELFGTFAPSAPNSRIIDKPLMTMYYEGGRNTPRGHQIR
jgi:hypothetical protein